MYIKICTSFAFTGLELLIYRHIKQIYISTRFNIQKNLWQLLHPKHFVNVLFVHHFGCSREKEILDVATIMRHGLTLSNTFMDDGTDMLSLMACFTIDTKSEGCLKSFKTNTISDIFIPFENSDGFIAAPKFILIEGAPGMGKTTLCREIAYQWAKQCLLDDTELLFLVHLHDPAILRIKDLTDLVHYFYNFGKESADLSLECAKILNNMDSNNVTIVLDGYDEFDGSGDSLITSILNRRVLPQCRIVVTSRLTASDWLHRIADVQVEILGFTDESKADYIKQELKNHPDKINELQSCLDHHVSIKSICYIPMMMTILVHIFKEKQLPKNPIEIYNKFVALTVCHHYQRQYESQDVFVSLEALPTECKPFLFDLSKFAFLTLQSKQKVFSKEDIENLCPNSTLLSCNYETFGLVKSVQYFCIDKGNSRVFNFLHLSLHEYLGAYYVSSIDQCRQFDELKNTFLNEMYHETWNMFIAMNKNTSFNFLNYYVYCSDTYRYILQHSLVATFSNKFSSYLNFFLKLYDNISTTDALTSDAAQFLISKCKEVRSSHSTANIYQEQIYITFCDRKNVNTHQPKLELFFFNETGTTLKASNSNWFTLCQSLNLTDRFSVALRTNHILMLYKANQQQVVDCFQFKTSIKHVAFIGCQISKNTVDAMNFFHLQNLLEFGAISCTFDHYAITELTKFLSKLSTLKSIRLPNNRFSAEQMTEILSVISNNDNLQILDLSSNHLHNDIIEVAKALENTETLEILILTNNSIPESTATAISTIIKSNTSLRAFCIGVNKLGSSIIDISKFLCDISTLQSLELNDNQIPEEAGEAIASVILRNSGLEHLVLNNNNICKGALHIAKALQQLNSLQTLCLSNTNLPKEACYELASAIKTNRSLRNLQLSDNHLGERALEIAKALKQITSLRLLDLGNNKLGSNTITKEIVNELTLAIKSNNRIQKLWLHDNDLHSSAIIILETLCGVSKLKVLNMDNNEIDEKGGNTLAAVIKANRLEELKFCNNNLQNSIFNISKALKRTPILKSLHLSCNSLTKEMCVNLAAVVKANDSLEQLWLHNSNIKGSSIVFILQALHSNLRSLDIRNNTITEEAGDVLASVLSKNAELQKLHLNLLLTPLKVTNALRNVSGLQSLVFDSCNPSEEVESIMESVIINNASLQILSLANINLSKKFISLAIGKISNLSFLQLEDNLLTEEMSYDLSLAISKNVSLKTLILLDNILQAGLIKIAKVCNSLTDIRVLQLAHNCIIPSKVVELTSIITENTSLERVLLGGITLNAMESFHFNVNEVLLKTSYSHSEFLEAIYLELLRKQIDNNTKCSSNNLKFNAKNFIFVQKIRRYFGHGNITHFDTVEAKQKLAQIDAKEIIQSLIILKKVKVIDLEFNNIDEDAAFELAATLHSNNVLEQLWLRGNKINTMGALYILNSLEYLTTLQVLDLSYNNIGSESADGIAAVIDNNPLINQLWLDGNDLHDTGATIICNALKKIRTLSILSLCNNGITDEATTELSVVIAQNAVLEDLMLSNNQLNSRGFSIIAESLSKLIKLRKLDVFNNKISKEAIGSLANVIRNSPTLQDLFLSNNNLETSGALEICNALSHINSLHVLTLSNANITDEITSKLVEVFNNNHLYALLIGGNYLESGALKIAKAIQNDNTAMQLLDFSNNNISMQDQEKIEKLFSSRVNFQVFL